MNKSVSKIIYLTIDDSPSNVMKEKVDYLLKCQIPAIWYCRGEFMENHLSSIVYALERGFWIANHSYSHPYFSQLSLKEASEEILKTENLIDHAYHQTNISRTHKLFRFPFGDKGGGKNFLKAYTEKEKEHIDALQDLLKKEGFQKALFEKITYHYYLNANLDCYIDTPWTFDTKDYVVLSKSSQEKSKLHHVEDFINRMDLDDPENGLGLNNPHSNDIVILHDFEKTSFLFKPFINQLMTKPFLFQLPQLKCMNS